VSRVESSRSESLDSSSSSVHVRPLLSRVSRVLVSLEAPKGGQVQKYMYLYLHVGTCSRNSYSLLSTLARVLLYVPK